MLQVTLIGVGKIREKYLNEGIKEYAKRLGGYVKLTMLEVNDEPCPERMSQAEEEKVKEKEEERILKLISPQDYVILLDLGGKGLSSPQLADLLDELALKGRSSVTFVIGGSLGVSGGIRKRADFRWSFSQLTFPHQLMRLILLEQIYRSRKISRGEAYHK